MTAARLVTEICAPWVLNIVLFVILGLSLDAPGPGLSAALLTGAAPMAVIAWMIRRGRVDNHHVTSRTQRGGVYAMILGLLAVLAVTLAVMDTPWEIWVALAAAVGFILIFAVVTSAGLKISVHLGIWLTHWTYLGIVLSPWWWLMLLFTPVVAWSRLELTHHSHRELVGGAAAAAAVVGLTLPAVL